ncbi:MAG: hypothetical protein MPEBLZ_01776 [Candidatus Methanoperedens nitroreducens]|uniref:Uncharacterized protein n=1 Tax=Candidatus Methanoperedens nitratireducens TaxID=1392998 RepID=A0A0P8CKJ4_9EURY|nr:hypothetical protein [Candidatus Methanoperedens sp. BLZ2]KAB2948467.1 MAG: hypothetical protein F9K14_01160 [Candidatus Methanoperedens sp.]KPQ43593.1 MAG: hypothetical protein MPEBLZ_01776 [Candidatus Methanoperedens sp. BLZ1]MBZ0174433.1 hypothetical protein [Candidatus Methanoperedens nitroreducens]MCX9078453.1 hypothetical protein [Candidatus Methanoperedens sp.]
MAINDQIVKILAEDMGPSASPFLERQCKFHLNKDPGALTASDMEELAKWVYTGAKLTIGEGIADKLKTKILAVK